MLSALFYASPDEAVLAAIAGVLLIYLEMNRPGLILPGAVGCLLVLLAAAVLIRAGASTLGALLLACAAVIQLASVRRPFFWVGSFTAGFGVFLGCRYLLYGQQGSRIHLPSALAAGILLGPGTSLLTAIARRARTNKGLDL